MSYERVSSQTAAQIFVQLSSFLALANIRVPAFHTENLGAFDTLPSGQREAIVSHFDFYTRPMNTLPPEPGKTRLSTDQERALVRRSLDHFGLKHSAYSEDTIEAGYLIEIYNTQNVQLYRNLEFFRYSGYSLMDVVTNEWFNLYQRPQRVTEELIAAAKQVFREGKPCYPNVPTHVLREVFSNSKRAFLMDVKSITPLLDAKSGECTAILTKIKAEVIAEGADFDKIGLA